MMSTLIGLIASSPWRCGVIVPSRLLAAIGVKQVGPHEGLQFGSMMINSEKLESLIA